MMQQFILTMDDLLVNDRPINRVIIAWLEDVTQAEVVGRSQEWITTKNFLIQRMQGLQAVGESSLTIELVELDL
ncbi:MAG: hypothetical protein COV55_00740 [Candidatus Komeilibacteria bacterium CG11_big_fil_rev_8_21_14_0_20_36_20]|uniref:Uncharacterized protein n=1 Tax=Candidatus Komeilibacteria bacterium CG11_big_fil_rev_8_21_14_0_20_36_20 TaxID=1974477 RepID=A0A2H0NDG8_9BACT|nr:MAG: hypothetical protein COV55_00740 [Candidatus Komeilibacteria bacterium CG11_big_fil_rev_8_21_14_0_20_36_20]PIR81309.1 MAG: hypothetical protein COU21_03710 [Candidatus Komeilibacteria bacterium CG10_big_fil_rev_8_21_14_0_10_36_65]PJC54939.1 MAG: hypothetical protein CO027_04380 [Candidatus Komeilibacteria bacterium CG_4_9_14_0_2_um_filter_36_13]